MNSLSWILYAADLVGSINVALGFVLFLTGVSLAVLIFSYQSDDELPVYWKSKLAEIKGQHDTYPSLYPRAKVEEIEAKLAAAEAEFAKQKAAGDDPEAKANKSLFRHVMFGAVVLVLMVFMPAKQTVLMIAASELGEQAIRSGPAQEILGELQKALLKKLQDISK